MVKHIVMWNLKDNAEGNTKLENAKLMKQKLEALKSTVKEIVSCEVGINFNEAGYDVALYSEFKTKSDLDAYQVNPNHMEVKKFVHSVITERVVADYEI